MEPSQQPVSVNLQPGGNEEATNSLSPQTQHLRNQDTPEPAERSSQGSAIPIVAATTVDRNEGSESEGTALPLPTEPAIDGRAESEPASEMQAVADEAIIGEDENHSIDMLRQKVLDARGSAAQLPPGWEDGAPPEVPQGRLPGAAVGISSDADDSDSESDSSSSSSSSSSDNSSSSDESEENLQGQPIQSDYDSDDSSSGQKNGTKEGPMTKNEVSRSKATGLFGNLPFTEVPEEKKAEMKLLGHIHGAVEEVLVIAGLDERKQGQHPNGMPLHTFSGRAMGGASNLRYSPILDAGSLVCSKEGSVIGPIFETFGNLLSPLYSILLPSASAAKAFKTGTEVFYLPSLSSILTPAEVRAQQGKASDASNVNDEEPNEWEIDAMEFSDDEEEAEWKRRMKQKKQSKRRAEDGSANGSAGHTGLSGRGRGVRGRGRGGRGGMSEPRASPSTFALPPKPNWQLDDPSSFNPSESGASLSYGDAAGGRLAPQPYDSGMLATPPASAGLPPIPATARPPASLQGPQSGGSSGFSTASAGQSVASPPKPSEVATPSASASPAAPPPGAHINPLFAHRWGYSGQTPASQSSESPSRQPSAQQGSSQQWSGYQQPQQHAGPYQSATQGYPYPYQYHQQPQQHQQHPSYPSQHLQHQQSQYPYYQYGQYQNSNHYSQHQNQEGQWNAQNGGGAYNPNQPQYGAQHQYDHYHQQQQQQQPSQVRYNGQYGQYGNGNGSGSNGAYGYGSQG